MGLSHRRPRTVVGCLVACRGPVRPAGLGAGWLPGAWWGRRVSWVRSGALKGGSWSAPGLAVPPPPGRRGSLSRGAWPGARARVARSPALPRGGRSPWGGAPAAGRASASAPTGRCRRGRPRSPPDPALAAISVSRSRNWPAGMPETSRRKARPAPAARGAATRGVRVLRRGRRRSRGPRSRSPARRALFAVAIRVVIGGPQPPVAGGGVAGRPGQVQAGWWPGRRGCCRRARRRPRRGGRGLTSTAMTGYPRRSSSDAAGRGAACHEASRYQRSRGRVVAGCGTGPRRWRPGRRPHSPGRRTATGHDSRYRPCARFARAASGAGSLTSSQPSSGFPAVVSLPHVLSFSPSAVRNSRADSHCARHRLLVQPGGREVAPRLRSSARPPAPPRPPPPRPDADRASRPGATQPDGLGVPPGRGGVTADPAGPPSGGDGEPGLDPADAGRQTGLRGAQVSFGEPPLILAGPGDRARPPCRGFRGQRPFPSPGTPPGPSRPAAPRAPRRQVTARQRPQMRARGPEHRLSSADTRSRARTRAPPGLPPRTAPPPGAGTRSPARRPPRRDGRPAIAHKFEIGHTIESTC